MVIALKKQGRRFAARRYDTGVIVPRQPEFRPEIGSKLAET